MTWRPYAVLAGVMLLAMFINVYFEDHADHDAPARCHPAAIAAPDDPWLLRRLGGTPSRDPAFQEGIPDLAADTEALRSVREWFTGGR